MNSAALTKTADLNSHRIGDFALLQDLDGRYRVQNVRTGAKTRPFPKRAALRVLKAAAK